MAEQPSLSHPIEWLFLSLSPLDITLDVSTAPTLAPTYTKSNEKFLFQKKERKKDYYGCLYITVSYYLVDNLLGVQSNKN